MSDRLPVIGCFFVSVSTHPFVKPFYIQMKLIGLHIKLHTVDLQTLLICNLPDLLLWYQSERVLEVCLDNNSLMTW